jgi:hypothetical protein
VALKGVAKKLIGRVGYEVRRLPTNNGAYCEDGLHSIHNHAFVHDPTFRRAYARGIEAAGCDYKWRWRIHIGLWVAHAASKLRGDFVECGVNRGFLSSAIMRYLDWDALGKTFYLLDTFSGIDERYVSDEERARGKINENKGALESGFYTASIDSVRANFSEWQNVELVVGAIPDTLKLVTATEIAYLHLDMNNAGPEVAAFEHFWDKLVSGALVLLDDYAYAGYEQQKLAMDSAAAGKGVRVASLPTGQGLLLKA